MELPESGELDVPAESWRLGEKLAPKSVLTAPKNCASSLATPLVSPGPCAPSSLRESCQVTATLPVVWSSASFGKNCERLVLSSLTRTGALQVAPLLSE